MWWVMLIGHIVCRRLMTMMVMKQYPLYLTIETMDVGTDSVRMTGCVKSQLTCEWVGIGDDRIMIGMMADSYITILVCIEIEVWSVDDVLYALALLSLEVVV